MKTQRQKADAWVQNCERAAKEAEDDIVEIEDEH